MSVVMEVKKSRHQEMASRRMLVRSLSLPNATPRKKISKIFSPVELARVKIWLCKEVHQWSMVCTHHKVYHVSITANSTELP